jgi:hypothetical protein
VRLPNDNRRHVAHIEQSHSSIRASGDHHRSIMVVSETIHRDLKINFVLRKGESDQR